MAERLKNAAAVGLFNDGKPTTIIKNADCPRCGCTVDSAGASVKEPTDPSCDCNCHETWRFINHRPVT